jgi:hypothetical protein
MTTFESTETIVKNGQIFIDNPALHSLLPTSYKLVLNANTRILSLLSTDPPNIYAQLQFTKNEWNIFITLLVSYPHYAPHEQLLASITSLSFTDCLTRLQEADLLGSKARKQELKPVHRALSGLRAKLNNLCPYLQISLIRDLGYALTSSSE